MLYHLRQSRTITIIEFGCVSKILNQQNRCLTFKVLLIIQSPGYNLWRYTDFNYEMTIRINPMHHFTMIQFNLIQLFEDGSEWCFTKANFCMEKWNKSHKNNTTSFLLGKRKIFCHCGYGVITINTPNHLNSYRDTHIYIQKIQQFTISWYSIIWVINVEIQWARLYTMVITLWKCWVLAGILPAELITKKMTCLNVF